MNIITKIFLTALSLLVIAKLIPGVTIDDIYTALAAALVLGLLNGIVRPILVVLTFPITVLTLGLFLLVINAGLFLFAASFIKGFSVSGFGPALLGSLIITLISTIANHYLK